MTPGVMRAWIARQFRPERRWANRFRLFALAWCVFWIASDALWWSRPRFDGEREMRVANELLDQARHTEDPAEAQRLRDAYYPRINRIQMLQFQDAANAAARAAFARRFFRYGAAVFAVVLLVMVIAWLRDKRRARRRATARHCAACNYDLRAHTPGDLCPECGTPVPPEPPLVSSIVQHGAHGEHGAKRSRGEELATDRRG